MVMADQELARRVAFGFLNELLKRVSLDFAVQVAPMALQADYRQPLLPNLCPLLRNYVIPCQ